MPADSYISNAGHSAGAYINGYCHEQQPRKIKRITIALDKERGSKYVRH